MAANDGKIKSVKLGKSLRSPLMTTNIQGGIVFEQTELLTIQTGYRSVGEQVADLMKRGQALIVARHEDKDFDQAGPAVRRYGGSPDKFQDIETARGARKTYEDALNEVTKRKEEKRKKAEEERDRKAALYDQQQEAAKNAENKSPDGS